MKICTKIHIKIVTFFQGHRALAPGTFKKFECLEMQGTVTVKFGHLLAQSVTWR